MSPFVPWLLAAPAAEAFTTKLHVALANEIHADLVASGDGTVRLRGSDEPIVLSERDARAIVENPLQFRAGAIGPDNFVFPAMTDLTHGIGLRPYDQCADLVALAETDAERAYALGCFLHGATDAVAHHYVNAMTGETFTLNPISAARASSYDNVIRHIVAEAMIEEAALAQRPDLFEAARILHDIPDAFVERALVSTESPAWARMVSHALPAFEDAVTENPELLVPAVLEVASITPAEAVALMPVIVEELSEDLDQLGPGIEGYLATLQDRGTPDGATLKVTAGADGRLGTEDDETACSVSCPELYLAYFAGVGLLEEGPDGEPVWVSIAEDTSDQLDALPAVYVRTVGNLSARLTGPVPPGEPVPSPLELDEQQAAEVFAELEIWLDGALTIKAEVIEALLPSWVLDVRDALASVGVEINLSVLVNRLLEPLVEPIREAIEAEVLGAATEVVEELSAEFEAAEGEIRDEYEARLLAAAPQGLDGHTLDHFFASGLWISAFNVAAAALSDPALVLPIDDPYGGVGGASFDASYTLDWMQVSRCPIGAAVFPLGHDVRGLLSVQTGDEVHRAGPFDEPPIECHDTFATFSADPDVRSCALVPFDVLGDVGRGSVSRAFPPEAVDLLLVCGGYVETEQPPAPKAGCNVAGGGSFGAAVLLALVLVGCRSGAAPERADRSPARAAALRESLGRTVWSGTRRVDGVDRPVELQFRADVGVWAEIVSPWGPGRTRTLRSLVAEPDGEGFVSVTSNPEGWPVSPEDGQREAWTVDVGRTLTLTGQGRTETFGSGPVPAPATGYVAHATAFLDEGVVDDAFCDAVLGIDHDTIFDFARGDVLLRNERAGSDVGVVPFEPWPAGAGFALDRVPGFEGTAVDAAGQFVVRYEGTLEHGGGRIRARERDDEVEGAVWVFVGDQVGTDEALLEVHSLVWPDDTDDEPSVTVPAGPVPIEIVVLQCGARADAVDIEFDVGGGWVDAAALPVAPPITDRDFPPAL